MNVALSDNIVALPKLSNLKSLQTLAQQSAKLSNSIGITTKAFSNNYVKDVVSPVTELSKTMQSLVSKKSIIGNFIALS